MNESLSVLAVLFFCFLIFCLLNFCLLIFCFLSFLFSCVIPFLPFDFSAEIFLPYDFLPYTQQTQRSLIRVGTLRLTFEWRFRSLEIAIAIINKHTDISLIRCNIL